MAFALNQVGQIGLDVTDVDVSEAFYEKKLGLRKLYRFGKMSYFDCMGVRLWLDQVHEGAEIGRGKPIYFKVADIALARRELESRGIVFVDDIHLIAPMEDHDLWMTFFRDPDDHLLALMCEAPKGYKPT